MTCALLHQQAVAKPLLTPCLYCTASLGKFQRSNCCLIYWLWFLSSWRAKWYLMNSMRTHAGCPAPHVPSLVSLCIWEVLLIAGRTLAMAPARANHARMPANHDASCTACAAALTPWTLEASHSLLGYLLTPWTLASSLSLLEHLLHYIHSMPLATTHSLLGQSQHHVCSLKPSKFNLQPGAGESTLVLAH